MKKVQIVYKRNAIAQSGAPLNLEYLLTCRELPDSVPEYGVGIRVLTPDSCEEDCADGITPRRERALELLVSKNLLAKRAPPRVLAGDGERAAAPGPAREIEGHRGPRR